MKIPNIPVQLDPAFEKYPTWRPNQKEALEQMLASNKKFILYEGPTGTGKSLTNSAFHKLFGERYSVYCCSSKNLQDQYMRDFSVFSEELKGKANYICLLPGLDDASQCIDGVDGKTCAESNRCPYKIQLSKALSAEVAVLNTWALLFQSYYANRFTSYPRKEGEPPRRLLILDEADTLEEVLISFAGRTITPKIVSRYRLFPPNFNNGDLTYWKEWLETSIEKLKALESLTEDIKEKNRITSQRNSWTFLLYELSDDWVIEAKGEEVIFTPINLKRAADRYLFSNYDKILLSSASFCGPEMFTTYFGIDDYDYIGVPSDIPAKRRPVYICPNGSMGNSHQEETLPKLIGCIDALMDMFPTEQTIIHTVSNTRAQTLQERSRHPISTFNSSDEEIIGNMQSFLNREIRILASPSMERGYDFKDDLCRINIIMKIPFGHLGDKSIVKRKETYPNWYEWKTIQRIVQMTGRSTRNRKDYSLTFILDSDFSRLWPKHKTLFSSWWKDSLVFNPKISNKLLGDAENG